MRQLLAAAALATIVGAQPPAPASTIVVRAAHLISGAGDAVCARRGVPHTFWNPGVAPARYLLAMPPRIYALIEAIHAADDRSPERMRALFKAVHGHHNVPA